MYLCTKLNYVLISAYVVLAKFQNFAGFLILILSNTITYKNMIKKDMV